MAWEQRITALGNAYRERGIGVIAINSNDPDEFPIDDFPSTQQRASQLGMQFPYAIDATSDVARAYGARKTPEAFLFDANMRLVYHGAVDDNTDEAGVQRHFLRDALEALLDGHAISEAETPRHRLFDQVSVGPGDGLCIRNDSYSIRGREWHGSRDHCSTRKRSEHDACRNALVAGGPGRNPCPVIARATHFHTGESWTMADKSVHDIFFGEVRKGDLVTVRGWVRTMRPSKAGFAFVTLHDGSCFDPLQVVVDASLPNYESQVMKLSTGASLEVDGEVVASQGKGQSLELKAMVVRVVGLVDDPATYPMQPKRHSMEFLREQAHLRPRTNIIGAVTRVRHTLAAAIHRYFHERGFFWINTPIITANDAEGRRRNVSCVHAGSGQPAAHRQR